MNTISGYPLYTVPTPPPRILIADDQPDVLKALKLLLKGEGFETRMAPSPIDVVEAVKTEDFDAVLIDLNYTRDTTSGREGIGLLKQLRQIDSDLPVLVMTGWSSVDIAVEAMQQGARDFIQKPWDNERLLAILKTQIELGRALKRGRRLEAENEILREGGETTMIAESAAMKPVLDLIERVGPSEANVLLTGAHGTGKGLIANLLHKVSNRVEKPLITVNAGGLPESIFESELFGHVQGAFTDATTNRVGRFELADGGTLFLDEIGNISPVMQTKLLQVVETGQFEPVGSSKTKTVDVRIISATNMDIRKAINEGKFREDLLFRLNTIEIALPPLVERREDIPLLAGHFLQRLMSRYEKSISGFDQASMQALLDYPWPGNVRELEHVIERAVLMTCGDTIRTGDLGIGGLSETPPDLEGMTLDEVEALLVRKAMARHEGNVNQAAKALGLSRSGLYRRLDKLGMVSGDDAAAES